MSCRPRCNQTPCFSPAKISGTASAWLLASLRLTTNLIKSDLSENFRLASSVQLASQEKYISDTVSMYEVMNSCCDIYLIQQLNNINQFNISIDKIY